MKAQLRLPTFSEVLIQLEDQLQGLKLEEKHIDSITLAGNGEPTLHPEFSRIVEGIVKLKENYYPQAKLSVLTNGTKLKVLKVARALMKFDECIVKLDAGNERLFRLINQPIARTSLSRFVELFAQFKGQLIVQSLFLKGNLNGQSISNMGRDDVASWLKKLKQISPHSVMVYTLDRDTPAQGLQKATEEELKRIKEYLEIEGLQVYSTKCRK
jgi:wyosine [tRNA(Phe)-imidazoG37] synthetase (radical SAM superfamily)